MYKKMKYIKSCLFIFFKVVAISQSSAEVLLPANPPGRPAGFQPFHYKYSVEQLEAKHSLNQMKRAANATQGENTRPCKYARAIGIPVKL